MNSLEESLQTVMKALRYVSMVRILGLVGSAPNMSVKKKKLKRN